MNIRRATLTAAVAAGVIIGTASAAADSTTANAQAVSFRTGLVDGAVRTTLQDGVFALSDDRHSIDVRDTTERTVDTLPLSFTLDGRRMSLRQQISDDGRALSLAPDLTGLDRAVLRSVAAPVENQLAMNDLINAVSLGTSIGSLVGTAIGAAVGIGVGIALAGASCLVLSLGCVVTVLPIVGLVGAAGGLAGLVLAGGPVAAAAAFDYWTTLRAEPGQSRYAPFVQGRAGGTAPAAAAN